MSRTWLFFLVEGAVVLPFPLYCIYEELWGPDSMLPGMGFLLAIPFLALYAGSFHGLAARLYGGAFLYYFVSFFLTGMLCWLGMAFLEGPAIFYKATWPIAAGISGIVGFIGLLPAYLLR